MLAAAAISVFAAACSEGVPSANVPSIGRSEAPESRVFQGNTNEVTLADVALAFAYFNNPEGTPAEIGDIVNGLIGSTNFQSPFPTAAEVGSFVSPVTTVTIEDVAAYFVTANGVTGRDAIIAAIQQLLPDFDGSTLVTIPGEDAPVPSSVFAVETTQVAADAVDQELTTLIQPFTATSDFNVTITIGFVDNSTEPPTEGTIPVIIMVETGDTSADIAGKLQTQLDLIPNVTATIPDDNAALVESLVENGFALTEFLVTPNTVPFVFTETQPFVAALPQIDTITFTEVVTGDIIEYSVVAVPPSSLANLDDAGDPFEVEVSAVDTPASVAETVAATLEADDTGFYEEITAEGGVVTIESDPAVLGEDETFETIVELQ